MRRRRGSVAPHPNHRSHELPDWTKIEIQLFGLDAEFGRDVVDGLFEPHERPANVLDLLLGQRPTFHPSNRLSFEQFADEIDERQHELCDRALYVFRIGVPAQGRPVRSAALELLAQILELGQLRDGQPARLGNDTPPLRLPPNGRRRSNATTSPRSGRTTPGPSGRLTCAVPFCHKPTVYQLLTTNDQRYLGGPYASTNA